MTLTELKYSILESIRPEIADDDEIDDREVAFEIANQRALWIRNEINKKNRNISVNSEQTICETVKVVSAAECCTSDIKCTILRTNRVIPPLISLHNDYSVSRIGPVDMTKPSFNIVSLPRAVYAGNGRFNKNDINAVLHRGYIYIFINPSSIVMRGLNKIAITGVFENPEDTFSFEGCNGTCYGDDSPYPLDRWMWNYIKPEVVRALLINSELPNDDRNDAARGKQQITTPKTNAEKQDNQG